MNNQCLRWFDSTHSSSACLHLIYFHSPPFLLTLSLQSLWCMAERFSISRLARRFIPVGPERRRIVFVKVLEERSFSLLLQGSKESGFSAGQGAGSWNAFTPAICSLCLEPEWKMSTSIQFCCCFRLTWHNINQVNLGKPIGRLALVKQILSHNSKRGKICNLNDFSLQEVLCHTHTAATSTAFVCLVGSGNWWSSF